MKPTAVRDRIIQGDFDDFFACLYGEEQVKAQKTRYVRALESYEALFGASDEVLLFSAPGRTEIGGNHTDHQHGRVLAAAVNLDIVAVVSKNAEPEIVVHSERHEENHVSLTSLAPIDSERNTSDALIRGIAARFKQLGFPVGGFRAYTASDVLIGSGLSSSAAFEVLIGTILNRLYADSMLDAVQIAQIGQYAENNYFGKPCGLMDQTASSVGGLVLIDFNDPAHPLVEKIPYGFEDKGYALCVVNTGGSHADLTDEYAAIPVEMKAVAEQLGKTCLRDVDKSEFYAKIPALREKTGDRAILRAIHFFEENERVLEQAQALKHDDLNGFLELCRRSGLSSYCRLQNVTSSKSSAEQGVALGLTASEQFLNGRGFCRVHGGGFAGTLQAYVPLSMTEEYRLEMERLFGNGCCYVLKIRPYGGIQMTERF